MRRIAALAAATALSACSMAPHYVRGTPPIATSWPAGDAYLAQNEAGVPKVSYQDIFRDPRLQELVEQALVNNRDLRVAAANLAAARAQVRVQRAQQFPEIDATADVTHTTGATRSTSGVTQTTGTNYSVNAGISAFELDLFGRLASATEAERQRALSTEAAVRTVRLGLVSDIANIWATYAADAELLRIAQETEANAVRSVDLTAARLKGGIAPRTDLRQAEQIVASAESDIASQKTALAQDLNLMQLLVGAPIDPKLLPNDLGEVVNSVQTLPAGTSSEVLLRRPDVIEAEYQLRAANAEIGVARAELFPRISLTGLLGLASNALGSLLSGDQFHTTAGGAASYAIFSAGGAKANVDVTEAQRDAALATYEKAIQTAFRETADALARQGTIAEQLRATTAQVTAATDNSRLAEARYRGGIDSYLENLVAQRALYTAQQQEVATRLVMVGNRIALYRALGGDQATEATP
jgi:multidrug efflux system outer membrane protein